MRRHFAEVNAFRVVYPDRTAPGLVLAPAETAYPLAPDIWVVPWDAAP